MAARIGSALSACSNKSKSESVEIITSTNDVEDIDETEPETTKAELAKVDAQATEAQPGFLWRMSSGVYNVASGAAGMGYNTTKWVLGKGVEVGSNVVVKSKDISVGVLSKTGEVGSSLAHKLPVPARLKGKDKKE